MSSPKDNNSFSPYKYNEAVESVIIDVNIKFLSMQIDKALDEGLWKSNQEEFQKLVDKYNRAKNESKSVDK